MSAFVVRRMSGWLLIRAKLTHANLARNSKDAILERVNYFVLANATLKSTEKVLRG